LWLPTAASARGLSAEYRENGYRLAANLRALINEVFGLINLSAPENAGGQVAEG
jgi:hypothetical protein